ncbi:MAG: efflux RND transporter permease subunit [Acidaminococcaceae bacterium]|nr:efflux RND transporter permease subunit [Acidaminococcaceae bacterium]
MSSNWAEWSIKHKQVVYFFAALVAVMGIISYFTLGRQEDPNFAVKQMVISTSWPGATAKQMEMQVTDKIEKVAQTVPDVDYVTSYSRPGVSVVNVFLKNSATSAQMKARWQEVRNLVSDNKRYLPSDIYGPYFDDHFDDVFGNVYAITSDSFSYEEMRRVASKIKDMFVQVPDVKKVELLGMQPEKVYIQVDNTKLSELGLSVDDVARVIAAETSVTPAAMKHDDTHNTYLRLTGIPDTVRNIESLPVSGNGRVLRLGDIAVIRRGYADPAEPKMYFNGKPAIGIAISMTDGGNNLRLGENLDRKIKEIRSKLPVGFEISQVLNQPQVVKNSINDFMVSLLEAIAIVLVVSLMTLGRKSGYVISCCIPLVLTCSMVGMYLLGIDLHKVSLGALVIALGMLVDDAVVVVEMIENKINEGWDRIKACSFAFESCSKPLLTGTMITCSSFMPIAFAKSNVGEYAGSLFAVITVTLMSSWFIAATVAPTLAYQWIVPNNQGAAAGQKIAPEDNPLYQKPFYKKFRTVLRRALEHRKTVLAGAIAVFCAFLLLGTRLTQEFFPASVRPELLVELNLPEGSSLAASDKVARELTDIVLKDKDVASVSTYVGKSCPRFVLVLDPVLPRNNYAQLVVVARDIDARKRMEKKITKIVEQQFPTVQTYSRSIPLGPPSPYPVMIRVSAPTDELAKEYADKLKQVMLANKKITMIRYDWMEKAPALKVGLDDDKLRQMGLTRKAVSSALYAEISGYTVSQYYEGDQAIDMVFRLNPVDHSSIEEVGNLAIPTSKGAVQLKQVADLGYVNEDGIIWRRNLKPTVTVNAGIVSGVTGNDVTHEILDQSRTLLRNLPGGVTIEQDGSAEDSVEATDSILKPVPAMLVIILVLLMIMLKDIRKLFVVVCTAPLGLIGVILGLFLFNTPLSVMAEIGALALVGTIIRNSTVLVDQIDQHLADGMTPYQAVVSSVIVRFRPIMLTALTTVLGLIPMFPSDFWRGLAIAMAAGLTVATMITLVILPVLYCTVFHIPNEN